MEAGAIDDDARQDCSHASHGHQVSDVLGSRVVGCMARPEQQEKHINQNSGNEDSEPGLGKQRESGEMCTQMAKWLFVARVR